MTVKSGMTEQRAGWVKQFVAWGVSLLTLALLIGIVYANTQHTAETVREHEQRILTLESVAPAIQSLQEDVREIREMLIDLATRGK